MKRKIIFIIIVVLVLIPLNVFAENTIVEKNGRKYCYDNTIKKNGFQVIDGKTYFFSRVNDNAMRTGMFQIDGSMYYFKEDGSAYTGWLEKDGKKYYFDNNGKRLSGFQTIDGKTYFFCRIGDNFMRTGVFKIDGPTYHFGADGAMYKGIVEENGKKYYYNNQGQKVGGLQVVDGKTYFFSRINDNAMRTGMFQIDGKMYYFKEDGSAYTGWLEKDGKKYYFDNNGKRLSGFQAIEGKTYFFCRIGDNFMRTGVFKIDGPTYHFGADGVMYKGLIEENGKKYYYNNNGQKVGGFQVIDGKTYFFSRVNDNAMRTGMFQIDGSMYYFKEDGSAYTGWLEKDGKKYYFDNNGKRLSGFQTIEGKKYFFSRINDNYLRTGWTKIDGKMYYFDPGTGAMTTGNKTIEDVNYNFNDNGVLKDGFVTDKNGNLRYYYTDGSYANDWVTIAGVKYFFNSLGIMVAKDAKKTIDVSYHNSEINWEQVKQQGKVDAAIIRVAYRGYETGKLVTDSSFEYNVKGALNQNLPVGIYVYSQAINTTEAIEEAERAINVIKTLGVGDKVKLPIIIDTEYTDAWENGQRAGRADSLTKSQRTDVVLAFLKKVEESGYESMIYASKNFLNENLDMNKIGNKKLWVAQYNHFCTYTGPGDIVMWQYSSTERLPGINTNVDMSVMFK